jgi:hypothetical protein
MKKPKHWSQPTARLPSLRDDRSRTWAGKTADSKVRHQGRYLATAEHQAETKQAYAAAQAKHSPTHR